MGKHKRRIITLVDKIWEKYPQLRFNQLMYLLQSGFEDGKWVLKANKGGVEVKAIDTFYVEDESFEKYLEEVLKNGL